MSDRTRLSAYHPDNMDAGKLAMYFSKAIEIDGGVFHSQVYMIQWAKKPGSLVYAETVPAAMVKKFWNTLQYYEDRRDAGVLTAEGTYEFAGWERSLDERDRMLAEGGELARGVEPEEDKTNASSSSKSSGGTAVESDLHRDFLEQKLLLDWFCRGIVKKSPSNLVLFCPELAEKYATRCAAGKFAAAMKAIEEKNKVVTNTEAAVDSQVQKALSKEEQREADVAKAVRFICQMPARLSAIRNVYLPTKARILEDYKKAMEQENTGNAEIAQELKHANTKGDKNERDQKH